MRVFPKGTVSFKAIVSRHKKRRAKMLRRRTKLKLRQEAFEEIETRLGLHDEKIIYMYWW